LSEDKQSTKDRLLDAAEVLFAGKDFADVSIRELATAADVNVAAVNYHFQGKENLYREVILRRFVAQRDSTLAALARVLDESQGHPRLDHVIETLVGQYLNGALSEGEHANFLTLIAREMHTKPAGTHDDFFREMIAPIFLAFSQAMRTARPNIDPDELKWIIASIIGQIHHFIMRWQKRQHMDHNSETWKFMMKAFPALGLPREQYVEQATRHITRFSTAAVDAQFPEVS